MATCEGARAIGQVTTWDAWHRATRDLILVPANGAHAQPVHDVGAALVYAARASNVDTTIVDGRCLCATANCSRLTKPRSRAKSLCAQRALGNGFWANKTRDIEPKREHMRL